MTNINTFQGNVEIAGAITLADQVLYPQKRWEIDLTSDTTTARFYPIYFASSSPSGVGDLWPINFKVFGVSLSGSDSFNEETLIGYARGGGYSDHNGLCKVHSRRFSASEIRFQGIWEGTNDAYGFVIYMRGGYKYSILTDASTVVENKAAYTVGNSVWAVKDAAGSDVVGTSANISQMIDINDFPQTGEVTATTGSVLINNDLYASQNVGIGTSDPKDDLHIFEASNGQTTGLFIEKQNGASGTAQITFGVAAGSEGATGKPKAGIFFERTGSNGLGEFHFCIDSNNDNNAVALSDVKMAIINNGNVGIGTDSPGQKLHINNNVDNVGMSVQNNARKYTVGVRGDTSDAFAIQDDTANAIRATITSAGRLKVGTVTTSNDTAIIAGGGATARVARNNYLNINLDFQFPRGFSIVSFGFINFYDANIVNTQAINVTQYNGPYRTVLAGSLSYIQISTLSASTLRFRGVNLPSNYNDWALNHWYGGYVF